MSPCANAIFDVARELEEPVALLMQYGQCFHQEAGLKRPGFRGGSNTGEWSHEEVLEVFA